MKKKGKFSKINLGGFFRGVVYRGMCVGECWEIKDKIGEKNFKGPEILGGNFWGKCKKGFLGGVLGEL